MSKIDILIELMDKRVVDFPWIKPIMDELAKNSFKEIVSLPQKGVVKDVTRVLGVHSESVSKAGIKTLGLNETRQLLVNRPPSDPIWSYGFSSGNSFLLAYSNSDLTDFWGCVLIFKKLESPEPNDQVNLRAQSASQVEPYIVLLSLFVTVKSPAPSELSCRSSKILTFRGAD